MNIVFFVYLEGYLSLMLLPYSIYSGALRSPDLLLSCSVITVASHISTILIITHLPTPN